MIRVGAPTVVAQQERFRRTEGALAATQAAMSEGVVPGGGTALLRSRGALDAFDARGRLRARAEIVGSVLSEPLYWIASNAGYDGQATIDQVRAMPDGHGLNALTGEFGDLYEKGVIDPVRVTRLALEHAASVAGLLLTTEAIVAEELIAQPGAIIAPASATSPRAWRAPPHPFRPAERSPPTCLTQGAVTAASACSILRASFSRTASPSPPTGRSRRPSAARRAFV